jgi:hypothetical protein
MNERSPYYSLFHSKPLAKRIASFGFPKDLGDRFEIVQKWLNFSLNDNNDRKDSNLIAEAQFLHDIFVDILGYKSPFEGSAGAWELELHPHPLLGFFTETSVNVIAEIRTNNAEFGRDIQPAHETTEWIIMLDYREICLYHCHVSSLFCQRFTWQSLVDLEQFKAFYYLLSRRTLLRGIASSEERSRTAYLLEESHELEAEILKNFYSHYCKIRSQLIKDFRYRVQLLVHSSELANNNNLKIKAEDATTIAIYQAQKLLNRILFVAYCQDCQLLPKQLIKEAYEFLNPYIDQPIWENYKAIFSWVQNGNVDYHIPINAYPCNLFKNDLILDQSLFIGDELCRQIKEITRFDFNEDITGHILTCLFDESVKELSQYRKDLNNLSKRRIPKLPCKSILQSESVIRTLQQYLSISTIPKDNQSNTLQYWQSYQQRLLNIKIIHPKCGAGVFLITALEFLLAEHTRIDYLLTKLINSQDNRHDQEAIAPKKNWICHILEQNLFGCDLAEEAIELTRLSLYLRSLRLNGSLPDFEDHIQLGEISTCDFGAEFQAASDRGEVIILK